MGQYEVVLPDLFAGGAEMGALMRSFDWAATPLGPPETWSPTLQTVTRMLLNNSFPILLWWGPDFIQLYNDAYIPVLGDKHPHKSLGKPFRECWSEVFHVLGPLAIVPYEGGPPTWIEDIPVELNRYSYTEEAHFTISYSPVPDPSVARGIGGVVAIVHEISAKIVSERRVLALRDLASPSKTKSAEDACAEAAAILASYRKDVPFALVYLLDEKEDIAHLAGHAGADNCPALCATAVNLHDKSAAWPFKDSLRTNKIVIVEDLAAKFGSVPSGPWSTPPVRAAVIPIPSQIAGQHAGFLVAGISSRLRFDDDYRGFLELATAQIATSIANARAYEMERRRNEALAEIDRAKTTFFSNISHELRTPLTLITGPIEEMLARPSSMTGPQRECLELAHRNSLRMLKLVNTLLDFSRMEAGRVKANFEPTDLSSFTAELAGVFRSTIERAGLRFIVDCPPLSRAVAVDRDMWEKIVFNLLSNAFKFTFEGEISVSVRQKADSVEVVVGDTGTGIPEEEVPNLFKRFHRVGGARGRSYEGSGIGLALVHELVRLHAGTVRIASEVGIGSKFTVGLPLGAAFTSSETRLNTPTVLRPEAFIDEINRWLTNEAASGIDMLPASVPAKARDTGAEHLVLVVDDNADMREYLSRLLETQYRVVAVSDGTQAIDAVRELHPDLILADIMMPALDGFGLLRAIREDPDRQNTPVILLSARAGEESRIEGMQAGADDYVVKPFPARELLARVEGHLALFRSRREAEQEVRQSEERFRALVAASSEAIYQMNPDWTEMRRLAGRKFIADTDAPDRSWLERYILPEDQPRVTAAIQEAVRTKGTFQLEHRIVRSDGSPGWTFSRAVPLFAPNGEIKEWFGAATDITARKQAESALMLSERLSSLGRMASTIAHEINNPLAALTNLMFLVAHTEGLPDEAKHLIKDAETELQRVAHITRQSLGFYRETRAPEPVRIDTVIDLALELLKSKTRAKRVTVQKQWRTQREVAAVVGEMRQVFSNLLSNSLDAIGDNGIIRIRTSLQKGRSGIPELRVTISDNGSGIPLLARAHIFEPLYTTKAALGTGLGLWVSRQIVERHHGAIQVRSAADGPRRGSTFSVTLPAITNF
jgi:PAS domain S-box-containing protein